MTHALVQAEGGHGGSLFIRTFIPQGRRPSTPSSGVQVSLNWLSRTFIRLTICLLVHRSELI